MTYLNLPEHHSIKIIRDLFTTVSGLRQAFDPSCLLLQQYSISHSQLFTRSMLISVWHHGRLSRNAFLGEVEVALDCRDLSCADMDRVALMGKVERNWIYFTLPNCSEL